MEQRHGMQSYDTSKLEKNRKFLCAHAHALFSQAQSHIMNVRMHSLCMVSLGYWYTSSYNICG